MSDNATTGSIGSSGTGLGGNGAASSTEPDGAASVARRIGANAGAAVGTATNLAQTAQEYGQKIAEAAGQAREYVEEKVSLATDKVKELQNADLGEIAENAKDFARRKPGQAILISAVAGLLLGLIIRGRR